MSETKVDHSRIVSSTPEHPAVPDYSIPPRRGPGQWCPGCPYLKIKTGPIAVNCAACDVPESVRHPEPEKGDVSRRGAEARSGDKTDSHAWIDLCVALLKKSTGADSPQKAVVNLYQSRCGDWIVIETMAEMAAAAYRAGRFEASMFVPRIYTRCPACHNDTLTINNGRLLCTWHECPDPTRIDALCEPTKVVERIGE